MRIVDRDTFLAMPAGTVFAKFSPMVFGDLQIKAGNCGQLDFFYTSIVEAVATSQGTDMFDCLRQSMANGQDLPMDFATLSRDGEFDPSQLFAVWSADDVRGLIARLAQTLA